MLPMSGWLVRVPAVAGCDLSPEDHEMHHLHPKCNFSLNFSFWDRVLGTYMPLDNRFAALRASSRSSRELVGTIDNIAHRYSHYAVTDVNIQKMHIS